MVVIPPQYAKLAQGKTIRLELPAGHRAGWDTNKDCTADSGPFTLSGTPSGWIATLPSLRTWSHETANGMFQQHFEDFLGQIDDLAGKGCISTSEAVLLQRDVREAVPVALHDTMLYRYSYSAGEGVIDLGPGMRLMVQRAEYSRSHEFQGTETVYYRVARDSKARLRIRTVKLDHGDHAKILPGDLDLGDRIRGDLYARLFFSGNLVPRKLNYSALVIGTRSWHLMGVITSGLRTRPQSGCPARSGGDAHCEAYFGMVTAIAELGVTVNGKRVFVAPGDNVRTALEKAGEASCVRDPSALRIERRFLGHPVRIAFGTMTESALHLALVASDRISCLANNTTQRERPAGSEL